MVTSAYCRWKRHQGALVPWVKPDEHSTEKHNLANSRFQWNVSFLGKSYQICWWQCNEKAKTVHQKQHHTGTELALSSHFIYRETWGKVLTEAWRECHIVVSETPHTPGNYQRTWSLMSKGAWVKKLKFGGFSALLIGNKLERPGKHLQLTTDFS